MVIVYIMTSQYSHVIYKDEVKRSRHCEIVSYSRNHPTSTPRSKYSASGQSYSESDDVTTEARAQRNVNNNNNTKVAKRKLKLDRNEDMRFSLSDFASRSFSTPIRTAHAPAYNTCSCQKPQLLNKSQQTAEKAVEMTSQDIGKKILVIGDVAAGKTSFVKRYVTKTYTGDYPYTAAGVYA